MASLKSLHKLHYHLGAWRIDSVHTLRLNSNTDNAAKQNGCRLCNEWSMSLIGFALSLVSWFPKILSTVISFFVRGIHWDEPGYPLEKPGAHNVETEWLKHFGLQIVRGVSWASPTGLAQWDYVT